MCVLPADERFLRHALDLAREAAAFASPNPAVGCVLVRGGEVLGAGAHRYDLRDHAEIAALKAAAAQGRDVRGATAYVTLEPCSHQGRTGPCAEALVAAGIARCVVATVDPNPLVRGGGLAKLRSAGVEVVVADAGAAVAQEARRLNDAFAFSIQQGRPFVTLKAAVSADGRLAPPPSSRTAAAPHWITGPAARADVQELRHAADALLSGIGTVLADDPELSDRTGLARRTPLLRAIVDRQLRTPPDSRLVRGTQEDLLLLAGEDAPEERAAEPAAGRAAGLRRARVQIVRLPLADGRVDLRAALAALAERGVRSVLLEAGAALNGGMLRADLVDRVVLYRGPEPLGEGAVPFAEGGPSPDALVGSLQSVSWRSFPHGTGEDVRVSGYLHDPWAAI